MEMEKIELGKTLMKKRREKVLHAIVFVGLI
jgi:hypothetical protein